MTVIWGTRIGLRPFTEPLTDVEAARVYRWSKDEVVLRWSGGTPTDLGFEEFRDRLRNESINGFDHRRTFFIVKRPINSSQNGELIGRIGCFAIDWIKRESELGIVIGEQSEWNKGYGREAVILLLRHLFSTTTLNRIYLYTYPENVRAQHSFAACGFRTLGVARRFSPDIGEYDGVEMEITRQDFFEQDKARK